MSRTLESLCCLVLLALAVPGSLEAATHPAPDVGLNVTTHALRAGDHGPYVDPDGTRALPGGDHGPYVDPNGARALPGGEHGPYVDPDGARVLPGGDNGPYVDPNG